MSLKVYDGQGRWRSKTVSFHMSPEEATRLNTLVKLSGLTKQDYLIKRVLQQEITVIPNPRVHKALKTHLEMVHSELTRINDITHNGEVLETINYLSSLISRMATDT